MRRFGEPRLPGRNYRPRPGVYAILPRGKDLLLTHQSEPCSEVQLPGGGIDAGESPLAALHREVLEETGWHISGARRLGAYRRFTFMPEYDLWAEKICTIYRAYPVRRIGPPTEAGHTAFWATPEYAAQIIASAGDRAFVRRYASSAAPR